MRWHVRTVLVMPDGTRQVHTCWVHGLADQPWRAARRAQRKARRAFPGGRPTRSIVEGVDTPNDRW